MRVGIVGAGITGLALYHQLRTRDVESIVFEAESEPGGVIRSIKRDGRMLDLGPQRMRLTPAVRELVEAAGVADQRIEGADLPVYVYRGGELRQVPTTVRGAVWTDLLSWRGKLRILLEPFTGPPKAGESVAAFFERALGEEAATYVAGPLYAGLYASDPAAMPVEYSLVHALERFDARDSILTTTMRARLRGRSPPPIVSFQEGMQVLPRGLCTAYNAGVHLDTPVRVLRDDPDGYVLETASSRSQVDRVVLTTPAPVTASLLNDIDPGSAAALRELNYNPMVVVHLTARGELQGTGCQLPFDAPYRTLGMTWNASLLGRDNVYTSYLGGAKAPEILDWSDDRLGAVAAREFETITGHEARPLHVARIRPGMPAYDRSWGALERVDPPEGIHLCANYESRAGIPGRVREADRLADELDAADASSDDTRDEASLTPSR